MAKILSVLERTGANSGKAYYIITCEGMDKQIISWNKLAIGSDVNPDNLVLNDKGDTWKFKSGTDGKSWQDKKQGYQKNDALIVRQVAFKAMIDLVIADKMDKQSMSADFVTMLANYIQAAEVPAAAPSAPSGPPTSGTPATPPPPATPAPATPEFNLDEVLSCDWATFDKKNYDQALAGMAKYKKLSGASAKAFLVDQFGIESSSLIPRGKRNEVIKNMAALA